MGVPSPIMLVTLNFTGFMGVDSNMHISLHRNMHYYPRIRLPIPIICWLPCRITSTPHLDSSWVTTMRAPYWINRRHGERVIRMIWGDGHDWSMWIITSLHYIPCMRPSPFLFLGQDVSLVHPVFLFEKKYIHIRLTNLFGWTCLKSDFTTPRSNFRKFLIGQKFSFWDMLINTKFTFKLVESSTPKFVFEVRKMETTKR